MSMPGAPTGWLAYIGVEDIHSATDKTASLFAKVFRGVQEVPGHGWMSILSIQLERTWPFGRASRRKQQYSCRWPR